MILHNKNANYQQWESFIFEADVSAPMTAHVAPKPKSRGAGLSAYLAGCGSAWVWISVFLASIFWYRLYSLVHSKFSVPFFVAAHAVRSCTMACHFSIGMLHTLRVDFKTSLYLFGSLLSSILSIWPTHGSCAELSIVSMPRSSALRSIPAISSHWL